LRATKVVDAMHACYLTTHVMETGVAKLFPPSYDRKCTGK